MLTKINWVHIALAALLFIGCGEEQQVYNIPKEKPTTKLSDNSMANMASMTDAVSGAQSENPDWTVPEKWTSGPTNNIRRGAFTYEDESGKLEITVTVFPGDVGGNLANVNRWAGQIQLPPYTEQTLQDVLDPIPGETPSGHYVELKNPNTSQTILAAILPDNGNTWFVKASGPSELAEKQKNDFQQFVESIRF